MLQLDHLDALPDEQHALFAKLAAYRAQLRAIRTAPNDEPEASIVLPEDDEAVSRSATVAAQYPDISTVFLVGIGGSNLGALAVHQAVFGTQANLIRTPRLIPVDTVDGVLASQAVELLRIALQQGQRVLIVVASKSGSTIETVVNAEVLIQALEEEGGSVEQSVVIISDPGSALDELAVRHKIPVIASPRHVGGRYSVFSNVGLFPLSLLGIRVDDFLAGGKAALQVGLSDDYGHNAAAQHAIAMYAGFRAGKPIHDLFCFSPSLELYGKWFRQLMGESVGKSPTAGIVPTVSIGSTDLHSVAQLYLAGPDTTFTTFVRVRRQESVLVSSQGAFAGLVANLEGQSLQRILDAILDGTRHAYTEAGRSFCTLSIEALDARSMGELMQQNMLSMMYLAKLLQVNAFDQPAVEMYKRETHRLLSA